MHFSVSLRILGLLLALFSVTMLPPLLIAVLNDDDTVTGFISAFSITLLSGATLWLPLRGVKRDLQIRDGFLVTALFWTVLGLFGALPFGLTASLNMSVTDAIFESVSGLTTTGATVLTGLDNMPASILLYRQMLQWLGGIGIIVVAVAVLPMLGIGGMQLYRAETPGPSKDSKLTPRITETAKALFTVYLALTVLCAGAYGLAGMSGFDAVCHAFATVAIGGFSTHDASMGYFESDAIYLISSLFMLISALNIGLHFTAFRRRSVLGYWEDSEARFFLSAMAVCVAITCAYLVFSQTLDLEESVVHGLFQAVSITTTTGFATQNFAVWPGFLPMMLLMFSFMGGCVGSTGGGIKAMRLMLIYKQGIRELKQLVHPHAIIPLKVGNRRVEATVVSAVWSFFAVYTFAFIVIMLVLMATGLDFMTAFSAVAAALNNLGPGLGSVAANYGEVSDFAKSVLCFAMLLGRLEVFTLLVLFTPMFWRN
ncbi:TrkH family potassium uptake protein [Congregibacter litoralis]|uniref:Trk system potassium uptake protein n=1 Tax=Congregibacter litoralis KT71 TaxID=314285 RepID=A4A938_9GAMM|nr:TrkH family potassium uptake protein [Congregibacter litoralis]EAQ97580.1 potassium uptake protein, TrkH family [Congregibacter litoralis KT71]